MPNPGTRPNPELRPPEETHIVLASASPRRRELLRAAGISFEVIVSNADEENPSSRHPRAVAMELAMAKAEAVARSDRLPDGRSVIIAADTVVVLDDEILGKPADRGHAERMLSRLSGRTHEVITGIAVAEHPEGAVHLDCGHSRVTFHVLEPERIARYVDSGECDDKAGAYGLQGDGRSLIRSVEGEISNVIGLPLGPLRRALTASLGNDPFGARSEWDIISEAWPGLDPFPTESGRGIQPDAR